MVSLKKGSKSEKKPKPPKEKNAPKEKKAPKAKAPKPPKPAVRYRPDVYTLLLLIAFLALAAACVLGWLDINSYK